MITTYLDMDGVLCSFETRFAERYGEDALKLRDKKMRTEFWPDFIKNKQFETLDWFPGGQELLAFVKSFPTTIEILSSSGGEKFHEEVKAQKIIWLKNHNIDFKVNIVPGRKRKKEYANAHTILIDDTPDVIESFNEAGGIGILHKDLDKTKFLYENAVKNLLNR